MELKEPVISSLCNNFPINANQAPNSWNQKSIIGQHHLHNMLIRINSNSLNPHLKEGEKVPRFRALKDLLNRFLGWKPSKVPKLEPTELINLQKPSLVLIGLRNYLESESWFKCAKISTDNFLI